MSIGFDDEDLHALSELRRQARRPLIRLLLDETINTKSTVSIPAAVVDCDVEEIYFLRDLTDRRRLKAYFNRLISEVNVGDSGLQGSKFHQLTAATGGWPIVYLGLIAKVAPKVYAADDFGSGLGWMLALVVLISGVIGMCVSVLKPNCKFSMVARKINFMSLATSLVFQWFYMRSV